MISLTMDAAIALYFFLIMTFLVTSWVLYLIRFKRKKSLSFPTEMHSCEYCGTSYMEKAFIKVPRCPTCSSLNLSKKVLVDLQVPP